ncbi:maleylacetoacetate isomerase [Yoonia vestfoldensis]|uniref:Maleylpyruvate isomerase n=1 Tax=Yoonia vestfoldensis TaxID=245188 RepID=A0A1Y0E8A6_9RHOB|nr:maleylacetoacetate isomerase [Yoonia vestfoldensis]ART99772.1 maleylpyruvate isomerase [Yoonia vestfoldensis]
MALTLYSYWRSTTSLRVRAALNLKGIAHDIRPVDLLKGDQHGEDFRQINPLAGVPVLVLEDGTVLTQSMAILDWIEETYPDPKLLPADTTDRARVRAAAQVIAMDVHPVNNLKVLRRLKAIGQTQDDCTAWMQHWMQDGFAAYQAMLPEGTKYSFGDTITQADLCLVGQMVNARRWGLDLAPFDRLVALDAAARVLPEIAAALPEAQPDATF